MLGDVLGDILMGEGGIWREGEGERCSRILLRCLGVEVSSSPSSPSSIAGSSMTVGGRGTGREKEPESLILALGDLVAVSVLVDDALAV